VSVTLSAKIALREPSYVSFAPFSVIAAAIRQTHEPTLVQAVS
jgi:hypothetical protein